MTFHSKKNLPEYMSIDLDGGKAFEISTVVVVVRLEHSHSFNDSLDNHSTASGPAWCRSCRPPGNAYQM